MHLIEQRPGHWYKSLGNGLAEPCYEVPLKSGLGMKAVTLREARVLGLLPSVTNVLSILNKPLLNDWRVEQGIMAALTLPRLDGEPMDAFAKRVVTDMDTQRNTALDFGVEIHRAIEAELTQAHFIAPPAIEPFLASVRDWLRTRVLEIHGAELCVADPVLGYGGKLDLDCTLSGVGRAIVDFKSQRVRCKPSGEPNPSFWDDWPIQLSGYGQCRVGQDGKLPALVSVVIDSGTPGPVHTKVWEDTDTHWNAFVHTLMLWQHFKNDRPIVLHESACPTP